MFHWNVALVQLSKCIIGMKHLHNCANAPFKLVQRCKCLNRLKPFIEKKQIDLPFGPKLGHLSLWETISDTNGLKKTPVKGLNPRKNELKNALHPGFQKWNQHVGCEYVYLTNFKPWRTWRGLEKHPDMLPSTIELYIYACSTTYWTSWTLRLHSALFSKIDKGFRK